MSNQAVVLSVKGSVFVVDKNGVKKTLHQGDVVNVNQTIVTENGGAVDLQMADGRRLPISDQQVIKMTQDLVDNVPPETDDSAIESTSVSAVLKAVADGKDISQVMEATAAGGSAPTSSYGNSFVNLLPILVDVVSNDYNYKTEVAASTAVEPTYFIGAATTVDTTNIVVDTTNPSVVVDIADAALNNGNNSSEVTFTFSEVPTDFTNNDLTIVGGSVTTVIQDLVNDPSGKTYKATFVATDGYEGPGSVTVIAGSYTDAAGKLGTSGTDTVPVDTINPSVVVDITDATLNDVNNSSNVTFTFSEIPTDFTEDDITTIGGTVSNLQPTSDPLVFTATYTAKEGFTGVGSVSVTTDSYTDAAGNSGTGGSDTVPVDTITPSVVVDIADAALNNGNNSSNVTFTFSEIPTDFTEDDITAIGGTVSNLQPTSDPLVFTATYTAKEGFTGAGSVSVTTDSYTDAAGNSGTGGSDTVPVDTINPSVVVDITDDTLNDVNNSSAVTFTFSEIPTDFTEDDITAIGGFVSNLQATSDPLVFTATYTAEDGFTGDGSVSVTAGSYTDAAGNSGTGGSDTVPVDTINPCVVVDIADPALNDIHNSSEVTFTFSEVPTDFTNDDLDIVGGTVSTVIKDLVNDPSGKTYTATFEATDDYEGPGSVTVIAGSYTAGGKLGTSGSDTVAVDTINPSVVVDIADASLNDGNSSSNVTFTFSEEPTDFTNSDLDIVGGTLSTVIQDLIKDPSGKTYTATFEATDGYEGPGSVTVTAGSYTDAAGNFGTGDSDSVPIDTLNPSVVVNIVDSILSETDTSSLVTFVFSEVPVNFTNASLTIVGGTLSTVIQDFTKDLTGKTYTATYTATEGFTGTGSVTVKTGSYTDTAGNLGTGNTDTVYETASPVYNGSGSEWQMKSQNADQGFDLKPKDKSISLSAGRSIYWDVLIRNDVAENLSVTGSSMPENTTFIVEQMYTGNGDSLFRFYLTAVVDTVILSPNDQFSIDVKNASSAPQIINSDEYVLPHNDYKDNYSETLSTGSVTESNDIGWLSSDNDGGEFAVNPIYIQTGLSVDYLAGNDLSYGTTGNDTLSGGTGNDFIDGRAGNDLLFGNADNDVLMGGLGNDVLVGGEGSDTLIGGQGNDLLTGDGLGLAAGADVFKWVIGDQGSPGAPANDIVTDFSVTQGDTIDLRDLLIGESGASDLTKYLHFDTSGSGGDISTVISISTTGAFTANDPAVDPSKVDQSITLAGVDLVAGFNNQLAIINDVLSKQIITVVH